MKTAELQKILDEHKVWVESAHQSGSRANLRGAVNTDRILTHPAKVKLTHPL
ncbi:hypothetical protein [Mixta mediterraneensis]|uniref:hypothetical protein n=1 Tax=Mixta mediterraneensis TaxID=2758443 RepID=UPI0018768D53|nr:hypothetical protein [Mixta mediterraneensis]MBE5254555.1 hypothetical protein [Mixta mediterraneensis]